MDATLEILRAYPSDNGYSQRDLRELVTDTDWCKPQAISNLRRKLRQRASQALRAWRDLPREFDCPQQVAVWNLIACARRADLPVYRILLRYEDKTSKSSIPEKLEDVFRLLPTPGKELSLIETLLLTEREPKPGALAGMLSKDPQKLFQARMWLVLGGNTVSADAISKAFNVAAAGLSKDHANICIDSIQELHKRDKWPPFVSRAFIDEQPAAFRRALFQAERLHTAGLNKQLRKDPYFHPDAPAVLAREEMLEEALRGISDKDLSRSVVTDLAEDTVCFNGNLQRIRAAITEDLQTWQTPTLGSTRLRKALQAYDDCPEALALTALVNHPSRRRAILTKASSDMAQEAIAMLNIGTLTELLAETKTVKSRAQVLGLISDSQIYHCVLARSYMGQYDPWPIKHQDLLTEWFRVGTLLELAKTVRLDDSAILVFAKAGGSELKFLELLKCVLPKLSGKVLYQLLMPRLRKAYREADPAKAEATIEQLVSHLSKPKRIDEWLSRKQFRSVARWFPETGAAVLMKRPEVWAFAIAIETPAIWSLDEVILGRLMALKDSDKHPLWQKALKGRATQKRISAGFRRYVAAQPILLEQAFDLAPLQFWRHARSKYSVQKLLSAALRYPQLAINLEKRVSRKRLRAELSWVRENWSDKPTIAVAYEVATAFSLPDAGLLVRLALKLKGSVRAERQGTAFDDFYRTYKLPKQAGGTRTIAVPNNVLKRLQRRLLHNGFDEIELHPSAMGFRKGRSIRDNAEQHVNKKLVVNVDIRRFFPSTGYPLILRASRKLLEGEIAPRAARLVAELCSYNNALPTGAPTSPAIANIVLLSADRAIGTVAEQRGISYTRYADDLTFSGEDGVLGILPFVRDVLGQLGYQLDAKKTNLYRRGRRQLVTGLVVNTKPNMPRRQRRELRAAVHHRLTGKQPHWYGNPISDHVLLGYLAYLHLTQPEEAGAYRRQLVEVIGK